MKEEEVDEEVQAELEGRREESYLTSYSGRR